MEIVIQGNRAIDTMVDVTREAARQLENGNHAGVKSRLHTLELMITQLVSNPAP